MIGSTPQMGHIMNFLRVLTTGSVFLMANLSSVRRALDDCLYTGLCLTSTLPSGCHRLPHHRYRHDDAPELTPPPACHPPHARHPAHPRAHASTCSLHDGFPPLCAPVVERKGRGCEGVSEAIRPPTWDMRIGASSTYTPAGESTLVLVSNMGSIAYRHYPFSCRHLSVTTLRTRHPVGESRKALDLGTAVDIQCKEGTNAGFKSREYMLYDMAWGYKAVLNKWNADSIERKQDIG